MRPSRRRSRRRTAPQGPSRVPPPAAGWPLSRRLSVRRIAPAWSSSTDGTRDGWCDRRGVGGHGPGQRTTTKAPALRQGLSGGWTRGCACLSNFLDGSPAEKVWSRSGTAELPFDHVTDRPAIGALAGQFGHHRLHDTPHVFRGGCPRLPDGFIDRTLDI